MALSFIDHGKHGMKGGMLIEALIGMLILMIVGAGMIHVAGRISISQGKSAIQNIAIKKMRSLLMSHRNGTIDLCSSSSPSLSIGKNISVTLDVKGCDPVQAEITTSEGTFTVDSKRPLILTLQTAETGLIRVGGEDD